MFLDIHIFCRIRNRKSNRFSMMELIDSTYVRDCTVWICGYVLIPCGGYSSGRAEVADDTVSYCCVLLDVVAAEL